MTAESIESTPIASALPTAKPASRVPWLEISVFAGVLIIMIAFVVFSNPPHDAILKNYSFTFHDNQLDSRTWFVSKQAEPSEFMSRLNKSTKTVILVRLSDDGATNTKMGQTLILYQSILPLIARDQSIPDQNLITLIEVYREGTLVDCTTDFGQQSQKIVLQPADCALFLNRADQFVIDILIPDSTLKINLIEFENHFVRIKTATPDAIPTTSLTLLKALNPKTPTFIQLVNNQIGAITGSRDQNLPGS